MIAENMDAYVPTELKESSFKVFEEACLDIKHSVCPCCHQVGMNVNIGRSGVCSDCSSFNDVNYLLKNDCLPIWYKDGQPQFHIPEELACLTMAEKMLIQLCSPFIPLRHIKNGIFGLSGHVCSFEQDIAEFVNTLPRHKKDVTMLNVLRSVKAEIAQRKEASSPEMFLVRKDKIGDALSWLKVYNKEYKHIKIDMNALDWLQGKEGNINTLDIETHGDIDNEVTSKSVDIGPDPHFTRMCEASGSVLKTFGFVDDNAKAKVSDADAIIHNEILNEIQKSPNKHEINVKWPNSGPLPIREFGPERLFVCAYPWLFPGGIGDVKDFPRAKASLWGKMMLHFKDGRFTKDKFFCFYATNYLMRHRNASSGNWYIKNFSKGGPQTLEELKETIKGGDLSFVNRLNYFNRMIKGSTAFWYAKRQELYSWINYHVEQGHGAPTFFITLSCGEYYWPDIIRLLKERLDIAGEDSSGCYVGSPKLSKILNEYSIVVQEYFQKRVALWLNTVGETVFGIKHYWVRFEFAPGRGQIHAHLVAITKDNDIFKLCHLDLQQPNGKEKRDARLAKWASEKFGLTAWVGDEFDLIDTCPTNSPCSIRFMDLSDEGSKVHDVQKLMKFCQCHECSAYCLRPNPHDRYEMESIMTSSVWMIHREYLVFGWICYLKFVNSLVLEQVKEYMQIWGW